MKAVALTAQRPQLAVVDVPDPTPGPTDVVVRVSACGVCGSDLHTASHVSPPGTILGHEIAGEVVAHGRDATGVAIGTTVAVRPFVGCGHCRYCEAGRQDHCTQFAFIGAQRPGGFAEYAVAPGRELFVLPGEVRAADHGLVEPFAVARRALRRAALLPGEDVVVLGAGPIGLAITHWARALGAGNIVVSDPLEHRRALALRLGASTVVSPDELRDHVAGGAPLVVECTGRQGLLNEAMQLAAIDGRVAVVGICLQNDTVFPWWGIHKEIDVRFSLYYGREDFTETIDAFARGALAPDGLVTETIGLGALPERFARLATEADAGKVVVTP